MAFASFEDINAWQAARELNIKLQDFYNRPAVMQDLDWKDQISRAVLSIMSNIAEGNDSQSDIEFAKFLGYAKRSASEVRSQIYYAFDRKYINEEEFNDLRARAVKIARQLANLINYLNSTKRKKRSITIK
ncbi:MAG: four helix bundle protein [Candidatus Peribacteraceae bacterium]|jgi:four helix bundle protein|nr:four helix bundle protein [Candidatus Peribacteraceae bacterium]MDP7454639.1 four helix bundle protein [Candidatus Peribacteraceae bacterium]MDP7645820.1 four helix bundle protein [Candidatus Peribacteraceae bacterium]|tara:strand:- start:161 stop:553 length:393 start_codon:yes stop_codon:yes gene_type:complete